MFLIKQLFNKLIGNSNSSILDDTREEVKQSSSEEVKLSAIKEVKQSEREEVKQSSSEEVKQSEREEVKQSAREEVKQIAREEVKQSAREEVKQIAKEEVEQSAKEEVEQSAIEEVKQSAREEVKQIAREEVKQSAREEVKQIAKEEVEQSAAEEDQNAKKVAYQIIKMQCEKKVGNEEIFEVVRKGKNKVIRYLLKGGLNPNIRNKNGNTPLMFAVSLENNDLAKLLIEFRANLNIKNKDNNTALIVATDKNNDFLVELLVNNGASVDIQNRYGTSALMFAAKNNCIKNINILTSKNANVNLVNKKGYSALMLATLNGHAEVVKFLIQKGADPNIKDLIGINALMIAGIKNFEDIETEILYTNHLKGVKTDYKSTYSYLRDNNPDCLTYLCVKAILKYLLTGTEKEKLIKYIRGNYHLLSILEGFDFGKIQSVDIIHILHTAIINNDMKLFNKHLPQSGNKQMCLEISEFFNLNQVDEYYLNRFLYFSIVSNDVSLTRKLLELVRDVNQCLDNQKQYNTLVLAISNLSKDIVELLLEYGANPNGNISGNSPIKMAIEYSEDEIVEILIKYKVDLLNLDQLLINAVKVKNKKIVKRLLELGASPKEGLEIRSLIKEAIECSQDEIVELLIKYKAYLLNIDELLIHSIKVKNEKIVKLILEHGANPNALDESGQAALTLAVRGNNHSIINFLIVYGVDKNEINKAFLFAIKQRLQDTACLLLKNGANYNIQSPSNKHVLLLAVNNNFINLIELLLIEKIDKKILEEALFLAVEKNHEGIIKLLLQFGVDPNLLDKKEKPLFLCCVEKKLYSTIRIFLVHKVNSVFKKEALQFAVQQSDTRLVSLLLRYGTEPNFKDINGSTPLHYAVLNGLNDIVYELILSGADASIINRDFVSPRSLAKQKSNHDLLKILNSKPSRQKIRSTHCWKCKRQIDNIRLLECTKCGWIICSCGACKKGGC